MKAELYKKMRLFIHFCNLSSIIKLSRVSNKQNRVFLMRKSAQILIRCLSRSLTFPILDYPDITDV